MNGEETTQAEAAAFPAAEPLRLPSGTTTKTTTPAVAASAPHTAEVFSTPLGQPAAVAPTKSDAASESSASVSSRSRKSFTKISLHLPRTLTREEREAKLKTEAQTQKEEDVNGNDFNAHDLRSGASLQTEEPLYSDPEAVPNNAENHNSRQRPQHGSSDELIDNDTELTEHLAHATYDHHEHDDDHDHPSKSKKSRAHAGMEDLLHGDDGHGGAAGVSHHFASESDPTSPTPKKPPRINLLRLFDRDNIKVTVVPIIGGLISGYTIALVPVYSQLFVSGTNCALYTAQKGCEAVPFADCVWRTAATTTTTLSDGAAQSVSYCGWPTITCRAAYPNDAWMGGGGNTTLAEQQCLQDSRCTWSYSANECQNPSGYSTSELGIFAGSMIAGNMVGAILGGPLVTSMGTRLTFLVSGFYSIITCVMGHMDAYVNDFWVLAVSRFVLGIFMGLITVACPLYVHENADPFYKPKTGTMFQVFATIGSFLAAIICIGVGETIQYGADADQHISARMQGITAGQTLLSILLFLLGIFSAETKVKFKKGVAGALNQNEYSYWQMMPRLLMVVALNATFRFTGFNALANFGPKLMASFKIQPFLGVFIILTVNVAGGLMSMPVSLFISPKKLFLIGSSFISCMCLFLCGIPVYPGVASESVTNNCAVVGICLYIFTYEVFVGPSFYVLCQEIFPPSFRPRGNSFAQLWQFIFNLVINVCYSLAVVSFSGGPSGNQHKGQSIIFIFFGALGLILFVYELLCLDLWDETAEAERKRKAAIAATLLDANKDSVSDHTAAHAEDLNPEEVEMRA